MTISHLYYKIYIGDLLLILCDPKYGFAYLWVKIDSPDLKPGSSLQVYINARVKKAVKLCWHSRVHLVLCQNKAIRFCSECIHFLFFWKFRKDVLVITISPQSC